MIDILNIDILMLISAIMTIASIIFSVKWKNAKKLLKETAEVIIAISDATEDDKLTSAEVKRIIDEAEDVRDVLKALKG